MKKILFILAMICSLTCQAQDIIVLNSGETIKCYKLDMTSADVIYYQLTEDDANSLRKVARKDIIVIKLADGTVYNPNEPKQQTADTSSANIGEASDFPEIDLTDFHGYLLAQGNCVYVTPNSDEVWDGYGVERIKEHLKRMGYWTVVDKPEQAHFILQFGVCLTGQDRGILYLRTRKSFKSFPTCTLNAWNGRIDAPETSFLGVALPSGEDRSSVNKGIDWVFSAKNWTRILNDRLDLNSKSAKKFEKWSHIRQNFLIP